MKKIIAPISLGGSFLLFGIPTVVFLFVTINLIPYFITSSGFHPAMAWFIGATVVFLPLFILAFVLVRKDGYRTKNEMIERFRIKRLSPNEWKIVFVSMIVIGLLSGIIMGIAHLLHVQFGFPPLETSPSFMKFEPFIPSERWMLSVWLAMFFFNIIGEELLWRGYILPRQEIAHHHHAWKINAALWMMFHLCFGLPLMILLLPIIIVLPYVVQKTGNTSVGILIHAFLNGPSFVMISLGIIG